MQIDKQTIIIEETCIKMALLVFDTKMQIDKQNKTIILSIMSFLTLFTLFTVLPTVACSTGTSVHSCIVIGSNAHAAIQTGILQAWICWYNT